MKLSVGDRKEAVKLLTDQGLSNRQIAKVVGASEPTVRRDRAASNDAKTASNDAPEEVIESMKETTQEMEKRRKHFLKNAGAALGYGQVYDAGAPLFAVTPASLLGLR